MDISTFSALHEITTNLYISWVIRFTDLKGLRVISNGLSYLNKKPDSERYLARFVYLVVLVVVEEGAQFIIKIERDKLWSWNTG